MKPFREPGIQRDEPDLRAQTMKPFRKRSISTYLAFAMGLMALLGHRWLALGWNAWNYPTATPSARTQAVVAGGHLYVADGAEGIEAVDLTTQKRQLVPPIAPADRIDDLASADGLLFALDATPPGHLTTYSLTHPDLPAPSGETVPVPVGPFSGVSAAAGLVAVSGGTSQLTLREYDRDGHFGKEVATADFGRGQPDIALTPDGRLAAISTHIYGPEFAITFVGIRRQPLGLEELGQIRLKEAGFTTGGFKPAHFPLVAAWRGDHVYVADGGGLAVIDASDPRQPRLLLRDRQPQPAMDAVVSGGELDVLRAGSQPAVFRYRLDTSNLPTLTGRWNLPAGSRPAAIVRNDNGNNNDALVTQHERGWQTVPSHQFSPVVSNPH